MQPRLSVLDLSPVPSATSASAALRNTVDLARTAETAGYHRFWVAEHHNSTAVSSSAPTAVIAAIAAITERIRVGAGGVMLPNHAPLAVAETFRVLRALYPDRIDLGVGRAPGTDPRAAFALRRGGEVGTDFAELYDELLGYVDGFAADHPMTTVRAAPADSPLPPVWILGTSGNGARTAAERGTGFAFGAQFGETDPAEPIRLYRDEFQPSRHSGATAGEPAVILCIGAICAETEQRAAELALAADLATVRLRSGAPGPLPSPEEAEAHDWAPWERELAHRFRATRVVGTPGQVGAELLDLALRCGADELMLVTNVHDPLERKESYRLIGTELGLSNGQPPDGEPDLRRQAPGEAELLGKVYG